MNKLSSTLLALILCGFTLILLLTACSDSTTDPEETPTIYSDAAESLAGDLAFSTGGTMDQLMDLSTFATVNGMEDLDAKYPDTYFDISKTYDPESGEWSIHIERERGISDSIPYAIMSRDYTLKYMNSLGQPLQYYIVDADTARTIQFNVIQGTGEHKTRRLSQQLNELNAEWAVTNANQDFLTINGNYNRAAVDTIRTWNRTRTSDHNLQLNISEMSVPRGGPPTLVNAISGHITGHFHAEITFTHGESYNERTIDRDIDIVIGAGRAEIEIGPESFIADMESGELID